MSFCRLHCNRHLQQLLSLFSAEGHDTLLENGGFLLCVLEWICVSMLRCCSREGLKCRIQQGRQQTADAHVVLCYLGYTNVVHTCAIGVWVGLYNPHLFIFARPRVVLNPHCHFDLTSPWRLPGKNDLGLRWNLRLRVGWVQYQQWCRHCAGLLLWWGGSGL